MMRQLILQMHLSLDGYVARPPGADGWGVDEEGPEAVRWVIESTRDAGAHLMGRATYVEMAAYWPHHTDEIATLMNETPKVVFSKTLPTADWPETRIAPGELADEVARLKAEPGADLMVHGGVRLVQALSREGLVDEYRLIVRPVAWGDGLPLFKGLPAPLPLKLLDAKTFPCGTTALTYQRTPSS